MHLKPSCTAALVLRVPSTRPSADAILHVEIRAVSDPILLAARSLQARGSKLILLRGPPQEQLPRFWQEHHVTDLVFESDTGEL